MYNKIFFHIFLCINKIFFQIYIFNQDNIWIWIKFSLPEIFFLSSPWFRSSKLPEISDKYYSILICYCFSYICINKLHCFCAHSRRYNDLVLLTTLHRNSIQYSLNACGKCRKVLTGSRIRTQWFYPQQNLGTTCNCKIGTKKAEYQCPLWRFPRRQRWSFRVFIGRSDTPIPMTPYSICWSNGFKLSHFFWRKFHWQCFNILIEVFNLGGSRNRTHVISLVMNPC